jgi:N6-adenosine-specific RNA methylase IME4
MLNEATATLKKYGKGYKNYSVTFSSTTKNGKTVETTDTTWHYTNQEQVKALTTLINDLKKLKPLSILQPDSGIYKCSNKACKRSG